MDTYGLLCMLLITGGQMDALSSNWQKVSPSVFAMELWVKCDAVLTAGGLFHEHVFDISPVYCSAINMTHTFIAG